MKHFTTSQLSQLRKQYGREFAGVEYGEPVESLESSNIVRGAGTIGLEQLVNAKIRFLSKLAEDELVRRHVRPARADIWEGVGKRNPTSQSGDVVAAHELALFAINDAELYRQQTQPIILNLQRKIKRRIYDPALALKLWMYLADSAAKKYSFENTYGQLVEGGMRSPAARGWRGQPGYGIFTVATRKLAAVELAAHYASAVNEAVSPVSRTTALNKRILKNPSGIHIVHNKLLGGWYVVRGPHQVPLNGRFDSREAAQAWLNSGPTRRNPVAPNPTHLKAQARHYAKSGGNILSQKKYINRPVFRFEIKTASGWQKVQGTVRSKLAAIATARKLAAHYRKTVKVFSGNA